MEQSATQGQPEVGKRNENECRDCVMKSAVDMKRIAWCDYNL